MLDDHCGQLLFSFLPFYTDEDTEAQMAQQSAQGHPPGQCQGQELSSISLDAQDLPLWRLKELSVG